MNVLASTTVDLARVQFATTSIYHFLFVPLTLGLGPLVAVMQTAWYRTENEQLARLTKFFGTLFLINFAIGVATGLVQEFEFGMNWSVYSKFVGNVFGAPLADRGTGGVLPRVDVPRALDLRLEPALAEAPPGHALDRRARLVDVGLLHPRRQLVDAGSGRLQDRERRGAADERLGAAVERLGAVRVRTHDPRRADRRARPSSSASAAGSFVRGRSPEAVQARREAGADRARARLRASTSGSGATSGSWSRTCSR